jgi:signal transduction histidine kinase
MPITPFEFPAQIDLIRFISHYAHDLRSPFNRLMGFTKIVLKGQDGPLTDLQKEDLTTVYQNGVYGFTLVNNLVDIARLLGGEKNLDPTEMPIGQVVEQAITHWKKYHPDKEIEFETKNIASSPTMRADSIQLGQALSGLVTCVVEHVDPPIKVILTIEEDPAWTVMTLQSMGKKARSPSQMDLDMYGYISQALIRLHGGEFRLKEIGEDGATIRFAVPKA